MKWVINRHGYESPYMAHEFIKDEHGSPVCGIWNPPTEEQTANGRLLVSAPKLLAALQFAAVKVRLLCQELGRSTDADVQVIDDTIAEATGQCMAESHGD